LAIGIGLGCQEPGARTPEEASNIAASEAQTEAFNAKDPDVVDRFYGADLVYQSYGPWAPHGMTGDREAMKAGVAAGMRLFPDRRLTVKSRVAEGDIVVEETEWVGTASDEHPALREGEREVLRDITFSRFQDGKIVEIREYAVVVSEETSPSVKPSNRTAKEDANAAAARRWIELFNSGTMGWWSDVYAPDVTWESYGHQYQSSRGEDFKTLVAHALELFPDRAFEVIGLSADGDRVIIEASWTGTAAKANPRFEPGDRRTGRYVLFLTFRDGKIAAVTTYVAGETIEKSSS
jgi:ketosteroid isomerase-like protein